MSRRRLTSCGNCRACLRKNVPREHEGKTTNLCSRKTKLLMRRITRRGRLQSLADLRREERRLRRDRIGAVHGGLILAGQSRSWRRSGDRGRLLRCCHRTGGHRPVVTDRQVRCIINAEGDRSAHGQAKSIGHRWTEGETRYETFPESALAFAGFDPCHDLVWQTVEVSRWWLLVFFKS